MSTSSNLLKVENLNISTSSQHLVHDVSFCISRGERVGLIGESGSGKSLTAYSLVGLLPNDLNVSGSVAMDGYKENFLEAPDSVTRKVRGKDVSIVFQEPLTALNPLMKVGAQVAEVITEHKKTVSKRQANSKAVELLASVKLPDPADAARAYPHQLSGGQRQRVMLAMALANDPALLLADEPTTALDVTVQRQVLDLMLKSVTERGTGLLFITHDLGVVANMCERVLVMKDGHLVEQGSTDQVFQEPKHSYTRGLIAASDLATTDSRGRLFTVSDAADYYRVKHNLSEDAASEGPTVEGRSEVEADTLDDSPPSGNAREHNAAPLISIENLNRIYKRPRASLLGKVSTVHALKDANFDVYPGERLGVVGESGSGKSTLLRILAGLDQPSSGSAVVAGNQVAGAKEADLVDLRQQLQIVFQDPMGSLNPRMKILDIVTEPLLVSGRSETRADRKRLAEEMIQAVGLPIESLQKYPHQFSGGQRQRISIARALICKPRVLVADEPVSALDVSVRAQVLNLLADLVDEYQLTLIFVSHDLAVVRHLCPRVVVMQSGVIVEEGDTEAIYSQPQHPYTAKLISSTLNLHTEKVQKANTA